MKLRFSPNLLHYFVNIHTFQNNLSWFNISLPFLLLVVSLSDCLGLEIPCRMLHDLDFSSICILGRRIQSIYNRNLCPFWIIMFSNDLRYNVWSLYRNIDHIIMEYSVHTTHTTHASHAAHAAHTTHTTHSSHISSFGFVFWFIDDHAFSCGHIGTDWWSIFKSNSNNFGRVNDSSGNKVNKLSLTGIKSIVSVVAGWNFFNSSDSFKASIIWDSFTWKRNGFLDNFDAKILFSILSF